MQAYSVRRLLALIPTLFFASLIVFVTVRLIPGSVIDLMLSQNDISADKFSRDQLVAALGLDKPMWEQYGRWMGGILLNGDFGRSLWHSTPVAELLQARLPVTFQLGVMALIVALIVAIPIGAYSAMRQDYIRTAWAKGLSENLVVSRHALRNALIPVVTLIGLQAPLLIGGAVIMEQIFVIPGMGLLLLDAVNQRDYPIITGVFLIVGVAVMVINLLVDLSYGMLDPKVRYR